MEYISLAKKTLTTIIGAAAVTIAANGCGYNVVGKMTAPRVDKRSEKEKQQDEQDAQLPFPIPTLPSKQEAPRYEAPPQPPKQESPAPEYKTPKIKIPAESCQTAIETFYEC